MAAVAIWQLKIFAHWMAPFKVQVLLKYEGAPSDFSEGHRVRKPIRGASSNHHTVPGWCLLGSGSGCTIFLLQKNCPIPTATEQAPYWQPYGVQTDTAQCKVIVRVLGGDHPIHIFAAQYPQCALTACFFCNSPKVHLIHDQTKEKKMQIAQHLSHFKNH